jgi:selenocysteine lyase/cysteine desulfurase
MVDKHQIGIRYGDFYAKKIIEDAGLIEKNGVVRVSLVHYNTNEEVNSLINVFERIF